MREGGQLEAGDSLCDGRYELLEEIGQGGFAHVWRAWDGEQQEQVAIKVLHSRYAKDQTRIDRFQRGARQMQRLSHSAVVRLIDEPRNDHGYHFFVMEYLENGDLRDAVKNGLVSLDDCWQVILSIGEALDYTHEQGIVHRDVKPSNILLDGKRRAKLTDFDLARAGETSGGTRTGMLGTVVYAAPEMLHRPQDAKPTVDVYGLGMTAIFALHGKDLPLDVFRDAGRFLKGVKAPEQVKVVLAKAVEWEESDRWPSVRDFCDHLAEALTNKKPLASTIAAGASATAEPIEVHPPDAYRLHPVSRQENPPSIPPFSKGGGQNRDLQHNRRARSPAVLPYRRFIDHLAMF